MSKNIAFLMDPIDKIDFKSDSTLRLMWEATRRNYNVFYFTPNEMFLLNNKVLANIRIFKDKIEDTKSITCTKAIQKELKEMDIIFIRQNPPFDLKYITSTYLLEKLKDDCLIINNPTEIRNCPEKIFVTNFPTITPDTLISHNEKEIIDFLYKHKKIILKPLYSFGGDDITLVEQYDKNKINLYLKRYIEPIIAQVFIENIHIGDKRIIMLNGKPIGAILRTPEQGSIKSNLVAGGKATKTSLNARDLNICELIGDELKKRGLILVGIDIIDGYLTEINVTSPTGITVINQLESTKLESKIWDEIEKIQ
jgi:glutathione synthase